MGFDFRAIEENADLRKLNLACGQDVRPREANWINTDAISRNDVDKLDIFDLPWPFESASFDYVLAKHILEHVPHNVEKFGYERNFFLEFIEEIWRVLRPNGILHVEVPRGLSSMANAFDHKRIITPETFHAFFGSEWSYQTHCQFALVETTNSDTWRFKALRFLMRKGFSVDITHLRTGNQRFFLRKVVAEN